MVGSIWSRHLVNVNFVSLRQYLKECGERADGYKVVFPGVCGEMTGILLLMPSDSVNGGIIRFLGAEPGCCREDVLEADAVFSSEYHAIDSCMT